MKKILILIVLCFLMASCAVGTKNGFRIGLFDYSNQEIAIPKQAAVQMMTNAAPPNSTEDYKVAAIDPATASIIAKVFGDMFGGVVNGNTSEKGAMVIQKRHFSIFNIQFAENEKDISLQLDGKGNLTLNPSVNETAYQSPENETDFR